MTSADIPSIDFSQQPDPKDVSAAISNLGFLFIRNGGVPSRDLVREMFDVSQAFFEGESAEEKEKVSITVENRGWVRNRQEALDTRGHPSGDIKEAFNLAKFTADGQPVQPLPPTLARSVSTISDFMQGCHELSMRLLQCFAQTLQLPEDYFTSRHAYDSQQSSILRLLYYPPSDIPADQAQGQIRAGAHSDYGSLTLLFQKSLGGLQIKLPNGEWLDAPVVNDAVLVNIGDLFDFWSGGRYPSTVHRVALPRGQEASQGRYSIAYFLHPTDDVLLSRIPIRSVKEEQHARDSVYERFGVEADERMTAREWLDRRLAATYKGRKETMDASLHVNGDAENTQPGPSSPRASPPSVHIDSYPLDVIPDLEQPMQLPTTVSPSELHSLSPHPIALDDGRMHSGDVLDDGLGLGVDAHMGEGEDDWAPADEWSTAEMRRVKVYELKGASWNDRGTGMCSADYDESTEKAVIIVKSEFTDAELLRCEIRAQDVYQRQQGEQGDLGQTLIVWTEPDGTDFALSFQDLDGCGEIWDFIQEVQRHLRGKQDPTSSSPPSTPKMSLERRVAQSFMHAGQIPTPDFNTIGDIDRAIKLLSKNPALKEKICETLVYQKFVCSLIELFYEAERSEYLVHLHALCRIMQTIIMLNEHPMYEHMLSDEIFPGVLGMLEYDPEFPEHKASYRYFLTSVAQYREAVPIRDSVIRKKIHQTYRLLFLKDVVLARMLDDPTFNILNSFIIFNQIDIVTHFQHEETILPRMFSAFPQLHSKDGKAVLETHEDPSNIPPADSQANGAGNSSPTIGPIPLPDHPSISTDQDTRRRDIIRMVHQLCATAKNVQVTTRFALYRLLVDRGVIYAIQWAFSVHNPNADMVSVQHLCGDILLSVMEYDPHGVRQHVLQHSEAGVRTLLEQMIATIGQTKDLALRSQIADAIRVLLEVQGVGGDMSTGERPTAVAAAKAAMGRREDPATEKFLQYFYEQCIISLYKPILALPDFTVLQGAPLSTPRDHTVQFLFLCDLLSNFVLQHGHRCQFYICASNIALKLASLLSSREKHVRLAALRVFRACFRTPNLFVTRHLIKQDVILPIIELTAREARRDNMLSSTCQEFFEYIRRENLRLVIDYMMDKHEARVRELAKHPMVGMRFAGIILRWEQNHEEPPPTETVANSTNGNSTRRWGSGRHMDAEEEDYFNADDETVEVPLKWAPVQIPPMNTLKRKRGRVALGTGSRTRAGSDGSGSTPVFQPIKPPSAGLLGLVDYDEEEEDLGAVTGTSSDGSLSFQNVLSPSPMSVDTPQESSPGGGPSVDRKLTRSAAFVAESATAARLADMQSEPSSSEDTFPMLLEGGPPPLSQLRAEKRRREEEEDELLALYSNGKRAGANADPKPAAEDVFPLASKFTAAAGASEGGAKKIKLSLGKGAAAAAAGSAPSSSPPPASTDSGGG